MRFTSNAEAFLFYSVFFGLRSKNGFLLDALTGMAKTCRHPSSMFSRWAAKPAENITRVSTRWSAAVEQAEPMAIPTSTLFKAQGTPSGRSAQVANPQCPQFNPWASSRVPINITHSALWMLSASRRKNLNPFSSQMALISSDKRWMSSSVTIATSMMSTPFAFGAVRAAVIICRPMLKTCSWRDSLSLCIINYFLSIIDLNAVGYGVSNSISSRVTGW